MFTGIVEAVGTLSQKSVAVDGVSTELTITVPWAGELAIGESVAVMGVCLTVVAHSNQDFVVQFTSTTREITTLWELAPGSSVNLERSVTPATRLGGHWVLGHIDTVGHVQSIVPEGQSRHVTISFPSSFRPYVIDKGSITVDGVSLTIVACGPDWFRLTLIPHTRSVTTLAQLQPRQPVNLEFDALAKYLAELIAPYQVRTTLKKEGNLQ